MKLDLRPFRGIRGLVAIAALAAVVPVAGCGGGDDSPEPSAPEDGNGGTRVLSSNSTVDGVGLESPSKLVVEEFGEPSETPAAYPIDPLGAEELDHPFSEVTGPYDLSPGGPPDAVQKTYRYDGVSFLTVRGRVIGILLSDPAEAEGPGIKTGMSLDTLKSSGFAKCQPGYQGETTTYREPFCVVGEPKGDRIIFTGDPIESVMVLAGEYRLR